MVTSHLVVGLIVSSITIIAIMLIQKIFKNQLTAKWRYNLWFLLLIALCLPYVPNNFLKLGNSLVWGGGQSHNPSSPVTIAGDPQSEASGNWMHDFSLSVNRMDWSFVNHIVIIIWVSGMLMMLALSFHAWLKLRQIQKSINPLKNEENLALFEQCKHLLNISRPLVLGESALIRSPLTFGIFKTYIVLPSHTDRRLSKDEMTYILLHELHHYKYKDIITNYLLILFQTLYWFNPLIWFAFRKIRLDREIACDNGVLNQLDQNKHAVAYGNTIIMFVDKSYLQRSFVMAEQLASPKKQLIKRMKHIVAIKTDTKLLKLKSILIFILLAGIVLGQIPIVSAMPNDNDRIDFDNPNAKYEDLSAFFGDYEGSFVLYDLQDEQYHIYNKDKSTLRVSPNSTYKIYSALLASESNVISRNKNTMEWNGDSYPYQSWNQDQTLATAMENSVTWYFQRLDEKVQMKTIKSFLDKIHYGNQDLSGGINDYWLESSLKISPIEQVQLLKDFYTNQFGFDDENIQFIKDTIKLETKGNATLYGKTGTGMVNGKDTNGWFIGYVDVKNHTYFFATNIEESQRASGSTAAKLTKSILHEKGIY